MGGRPRCTAAPVHRVRQGEAMSPATSPDEALAAAVLEIERHAAAAGWDQPARLFALVETAELVAREPQLAASLGDATAHADRAGGPRPRASLEDQLDRHHLARDGPRLRRPGRAVRAAARRRGASCPTTPASAAAYASEHPDRQEVRIVAAATRTGASYCALRLRAHDEDDLGADRTPTLCRAC